MPVGGESRLRGYGLSMDHNLTYGRWPGILLSGFTELVRSSVVSHTPIFINALHSWLRKISFMACNVR